jgi:proline iminopeptidase
MKITALLIGFLFFVTQSSGQNLYLRTFGDAANNAVIFLHGGPGYNAASFEATTAQVFADEGFYVIVYDRRGEGRSSRVPADFTFDEAIADINFIYDSLNISSASLIGHSFGGVIGTKYAVAEKEKVRSLILVSAPVNLQETFKTIISSCRNICKEKKDNQSLAFVDALAEMDSTTIAYSSGCFALAMRNGFYEPKKPKRLSKKIKQKFKKKTDLYAIASKMEQAGPLGFMRNENYTCIDLSADLKHLIDCKVKVYGIYGMDDGLYSMAQFDYLNSLINYNAYYYERSSHSPFIDFQKAFLFDVGGWCK